MVSDYEGYRNVIYSIWGGDQNKIDNRLVYAYQLSEDRNIYCTSLTTSTRPQFLEIDTLGNALPRRYYWILKPLTRFPRKLKCQIYISYSWYAQWTTLAPVSFTRWQSYRTWQELQINSAEPLRRCTVMGGLLDTAKKQHSGKEKLVQHTL